MTRLAALGTLLWLLALPLKAETDAIATAERAAVMLEDAGVALQEAEGARDRVEALTATVRAYEEGLLALREGIRQAALRERAILQRFEVEREQLARLLSVLQTIEARPQDLFLLHPDGPLGTARSGMIIADVAPAVIAEARVLQSQLQELANLREAQDVAFERLSLALNQVQDARTLLSQAIADRRSLPANFSANAAAMEALVASVNSLDLFAALLEADPATTRDTVRFADARGTLQLPVLGRLLRDFNEPDAAGVPRPGHVYAARAAALVTAPWPGTVRYAGPLLDYGNVIILEPEAAYLLIMTGFGPTFVATGDLVTLDAPLGLMPGGGLPDVTGLFMNVRESSGAALSETFYMELRENGTPVDPTDWFDLEAARQN